MTSVCHPFIFIGTILLPDDCSDVYHQLEYVIFKPYNIYINHLICIILMSIQFNFHYSLALCFVSAAYSLLLGLIILSYLIYHIYLIYIGKTTNERRNCTADIYCRNGPFSCIGQLISCKY